MTSSNDTDPFDTLSLVETDASSDFELVDIDNEDQALAMSSVSSDVESSASDAPSAPPSPRIEASRFHFPDPVSVFQDQSVNLDSSSLYTLLAPSQQLSAEPVTLHNHPESSALDSNEVSLHKPPPVHVLDHVQRRNHEPFQLQEKQPVSKLPVRPTTVAARRAAWLVALFAAVLLGFKSSSMLGFHPQASTSLGTSTVDATLYTKFASPPPSPTAASASASQRAPPGAFSLRTAPAALSSSPSSLSLSCVSQQPCGRFRRKRGKAKPRDADATRPRPCSVALQDTASNGLSVIKRPFTSLGFLESPTRRSTAPVCRTRSARYAAYVGQKIFQLHPDSPVLPLTADTAYLDNATTTTWAFWLAELHNYYSLVLRPALLAARTQTIQAARLARRYHQQQVLPAFASLCQHAVQTAHRTAVLGAQYNQEQLRPALAFVREQATQTAQRTAEYHGKVFAPAMEQFRQQATEAAKTTSHGLNKAARRFSAEAAETIQQVKEATHLDLEALGVDEYVGFMMHTFKAIKPKQNGPSAFSACKVN